MAPKMSNVEVTQPRETPKGETTVRRNISSPYALTETPHPAVRTIYDLFQFNASRWAENPCFGTRNVIQMHVENDSEGKSRTLWELGPYEFRTYKQVALEGLNVGSGLRALGLEKGDKIAIYADTSYLPVSFRANSVYIGN